MRTDLRTSLSGILVAALSVLVGGLNCALATAGTYAPPETKVTGKLVAGQPGDRFTLEIDFHDGQRHLRIISLKRAA